MALWEIKTSPIKHPELQNVVPEEVLVEFDGPLTFTFRDSTKLLKLAHLAAVGVGLSRYLVCPTDENTVEDLKSGMLSIRASLLKFSPLWVVDVAVGEKVRNIWAVTENDLPAGALPDADVLLTAELEEAQQADGKLARFARSGSDAEVAVDGAPVVDYTIEADFWGKFCQGTTALWDKICKAADILSTPPLRLGLSHASSYAVDFKIDEPRKDPFAMFGDSPAPDAKKVRQAFERLMSILAEDHPADEIIRLIQTTQPLRHDYGELLELLSNKQATIAIRTRSKPGRRNVSTSQAQDRLLVVRKLGYPYSHLVVTGHMVGGVVEKVKRTDLQFYIRASENDKSTIYSGRISDDAAAKMHDIKYGQFVEAKLRIEEEAGKEQTYTLEDVKALPEPTDTNQSAAG